MKKIFFVAILIVAALMCTVLVQAAFAEANSTSTPTMPILNQTDIEQITAFLGVLVGVILRTAWPFLKKESQSTATFTFQYRYLLTALFALIVAFATALATFQTFTISTSAVSYVEIFWQGFLYGLGLNTLINLGVDSQQPADPKKASEPAKSTTPQ
jgi:hypothetical protein